MKEKPSAVKKLLKPQKGILRLVVEREVEGGNMRYLTSEAPPPSGNHDNHICDDCTCCIVTEMTSSNDHTPGQTLAGATSTANGHTPLRELKSTGDIKGVLVCPLMNIYNINRIQLEQ